MIDDSTLFDRNYGVFIINADFGMFTRKPKTQMINGHEVVAPRYDIPSSNSTLLIFHPVAEDGLKVITGESYQKCDWHKFGFGYFIYDSDEDYEIAKEYANAHKENKNE